MIRTITVRTHQIANETTLSLTNPWDTGLAITKIDGLGPPKANINTVDLTGSHTGSFYNGAKVTTRNIVISFQLIEVIQNGGVTKTVEDVRNDTYKIFPLASKVTLTIVTDRKRYMIDGYVESIEPDIFNKNETLNISIICPQVYFYEKTSRYGAAAQSILMNEFEYPFANESLYNSLIQMGTITQSSTEQYINRIAYDGDVPTGFAVTVEFSSAPQGNYLVINTSTGTNNQANEAYSTFTIDWTRVGTTPAQGDSLFLSTIDGAKTVELSGVGSIMHKIGSDVQWGKLYPGDNSIRIQDKVEKIVTVTDPFWHTERVIEYHRPDAYVEIDVVKRYIGI